MADNTVKRHPIRGFLYGIVFGLGLALVAIGQSWAALGTLPPFILLVVGIIVGTVWSTFGPPKGPKGETPMDPDPGPTPEPEPEPEPSAEANETLSDPDDGPAATPVEDPVDEMNEMS